MVECPAGKLAGLFMRFAIRDLLWATVVVAIGSLLLVQRLQFVGEIESLKRALEPFARSVGVSELRPPPGKRRAIVDFPPHGKGTTRIRYEAIPGESDE